MSRKKISNNNQKNQTNTARRSRGKKGVSLPVRYRFLMLACGACLIVGFFFAARQHFSSIDFSIKNSRLRKMSEELESDKRRLLLSKEIALSPVEIKKAAQKIGFKVMNASSAVVSSFNAAKTEKLPADKSINPKPKQKAADKADEPSAAAEKIPAKKIKEEKPTETKIKKDTAQATR